MAHGRSATSVAARVNPEELVVSRLRALRGPNVWRLAPVIACDISLGTLGEVTSADMPGFTDRLLHYLPTLHEHPCSPGHSGGFTERLRDGTHLPHILEHVSLELQTLAGTEVEFGRVVESSDPDVCWLIVAYEEEELGIESVREAERLVRACMTGAPYDARAAVDQLCSLYEQARLGPSTAAIVDEANRRDIPVRRLNSRSLVQLGLGVNLRRIQAAMSDHTSAIAMEIAQDKEDTRRVLGNIGLPVPEGASVGSLEAAIRAAQEIGFPVILKPADSSQGRGISEKLLDVDGIVRSWPIAIEHSRRVVVERFAEGRDHRVLVVGGKVVAVAERRAAQVHGDGRRTIRQLIDEANRDSRRGHGHTKPLTKLPADSVTADFLARRGLTLESVPAAGEVVLLRSTANLSTGGSSIDRTDEIHPDNVTACEMAAGIVGLDIAGIDVLTPDISDPFRANGAVIIEVNAAPGLRMHTHPSEGKPRPVGAPIIDLLYPPGVPTTIPVIAVTGTNGKTTTVRLIAHIFRHMGKTVGFTTTDGVYLQNRMVIAGDMTGPFSANVVLSNPTVEVAVLETARGGILRGGLGFDECDVGVVLNVSSDHLGLRGIHTVDQMAEVKSVVPAVVRREGHAVLNADEPLVHEMRRRTRADVVLFSAAPAVNEPFQEHVDEGGIGACVEDDLFVVRRGRLRIPIADLREVPLTMSGAARFQIGNILAAIATTYVQGVRYDTIRAGLLSFFPSPTMTPGRLNLIRLGGARVLVDYGHNSAAVQGLMDLTRAMQARRRVGVVAAPGDRRDEDLKQLGRIVAPVLDRVILREDKDLRGRRPGEAAWLIGEGLRESGFPEDRTETVLDESDAVERALETLEDGDLAVILVDDVHGVLAQVQRGGSPV